MIPINDIEQMAVYIVKSGLFGVNNANQAVALMLLAQAENLHPMQAIREYHIIDGRPSLRADAMLARFQQAGGRVEWHEVSNERCDGTFTHPQGGSLRVTWTMDDAKRAGLLVKASGKPAENWMRYPRAMLRARVISEGIRSVYPGVIVGIYTPEEVADIEPSQVKLELSTTAPAQLPAQTAQAEVVEAQPLPQPEPQTTPQPQSKKTKPSGAVVALARSMDDCGLTEKHRELALAVLSTFFGRTIESRKTLSDSEALEAMRWFDQLHSLAQVSNGVDMLEFFEAYTAGVLNGDGPAGLLADYITLQQVS